MTEPVSKLPATKEASKEDKVAAANKALEAKKKALDVKTEEASEAHREYVEAQLACVQLENTPEPAPPTEASPKK